jgi:hypothetical protein
VNGLALHPDPRHRLDSPRGYSVQSPTGAAVQGHLTPLAALRNVKQDDATSAVNALPDQPEHLATTHLREEGL